MSDLDLVISCDCTTTRGKCELSEGMLSIMARDPLFIDILTAGSERISLLYESRGIARQVDLLFANNYPAALLYFTGSKEFNERVRAAAKRQGMTLNQNGLFMAGRVVNAKTEGDIFAALKLPYLRPPDRR
jgi:DNA polymerase (family 10)